MKTILLVSGLVSLLLLTSCKRSFEERNKPLSLGEGIVTEMFTPNNAVDWVVKTNFPTAGNMFQVILFSKSSGQYCRGFSGKELTPGDAVRFISVTYGMRTSPGYDTFSVVEAIEVRRY